MNTSKVLITYSSRTGNTEKVAMEILKAAEVCLSRESKNSPSFTFCPLSEAPGPDDYDTVIVGLWIDKGKPNREAQEYIKRIKNKKTAFFFTLGAYPDSPHAEKCREEIKALFQTQNNTPMGEFLCQGKADERLLEAFKSFPKDHPHAYTEENAKLYAVAASHPDEEDLRRAREVFLNIFERLNRYV